MRHLNQIQSLELKGRRVFVRVDFNVPLKAKADGGWEVSDESRIEGALETIRYIIKEGGKCILASHLGRPNGKPNKKYSLEPVGQRLSEKLGQDVILTEDCIGDGPRSLSQQMRPGEVLLLENLRFHSGEEENSTEFANRLLELCEFYVSDAFGTLHRAHASTAALPRLVSSKGIGFLVQKELHFLEPLRDNPQRPFVLVMGGSKVSDKIGVLEHFISKVDTVLIGGAMAYAFLKAQGQAIGKSLCDERQVAIATRLMKSAEARNVKFLLPKDHVAARSLEDTGDIVVTQGPDINADRMGVDIGPRTLLAYAAAMEGAETIFWNGPMGVFEVPAFANGTFELARMISQLKARKLAGGGDVAAAIAKSGCEARFDFISTGGGATLEYLEGKELPGLKALELYSRAS
jgi:phosphoglycerate kinase